MRERLSVEGEEHRYAAAYHLAVESEHLIVRFADNGGCAVIFQFHEEVIAFWGEQVSHRLIIMTADSVLYGSHVLNIDVVRHHI